MSAKVRVAEGRQWWRRPYNELLALSPGDLDAQVRAAIEAGFASQVRVVLFLLVSPSRAAREQESRWLSRGTSEPGFSRQKAEKVHAAALDRADPVLHVALAVAQARLEMAGDGASACAAQGWLDEARHLAAEQGAELDQVFDLQALRAQVEAPPRVVDGRFAPDPTVSFDRERWVVCRCGRPGVQRRQSDVPFTCLGCGRRDASEMDTSGSRRRPLLLTTEVSTLGTLWASNRRHLDQLRCYVTATVRDERAGWAGGCCCYQASWYATLPAWVTAAKHRGRVLKGVARLAAIADKSGLD